MNNHASTTRSASESACVDTAETRLTNVSSSALGVRSKLNKPARLTHRPNRDSEEKRKGETAERRPSIRARGTVRSTTTLSPHSRTDLTSLIGGRPPRQRQAAVQFVVLPLRATLARRQPPHQRRRRQPQRRGRGLGHWLRV